MTADRPPTFPNVEWIPTKARQSNNLPTRYALFALCQLGICLRLVRMRRKYQKSIVLTAPDILPVVLLKALGKQVFTYVDGKPVALFLQMCCRLSFVFSSILLAETWSLLDFWGIRNRTKARRGALYADTAYFVMTRKLADRDCKVGFWDLGNWKRYPGDAWGHSPAEMNGRENWLSHRRKRQSGRGS